MDEGTYNRRDRLEMQADDFGLRIPEGVAGLETLIPRFELLGSFYGARPEAVHTALKTVATNYGDTLSSVPKENYIRELWALLRDAIVEEASGEQGSNYSGIADFVWEALAKPRGDLLEKALRTKWVSDLPKRLNLIQQERTKLRAQVRRVP